MTRRATELSSLRRLAFLTLPNYSMIALSNALEACRMANYVGGSDAYTWQVVTLDGRPAMASNGLSLTPTVPLAALDGVDLLLVCGGVDVRHAVGKRLVTQLKALSLRGIALGALCTGTFALAEAGLLDGYRAAIHWENLSAVREEFPETGFVDDLFVIDRDRLTCTGGVAPLDMMLALIRARLGADLASRVSAQFIVERVREAGDRQSGAALHDGKPVGATLTRSVQLMREHIETPLDMGSLAGQVGISARQLERLFRRDFQQSPAKFYMSLRLERARELLRLSALSITEIGFACGFQSASHFSAAYSLRFGHPPRAERKLAS
jgi:transcriptional regulator GlxA family with amidase domain